jgi:hypothetical protein
MLEMVLRARLCAQGWIVEDFPIDCRNLVQECDVIDIANSVLGESGLFFDLPDFKIRV